MTASRIILLILLVTPATTWAQSTALFDTLDERRMRGEITAEEWYYTKIDSGYISEFVESAWVKAMDSLQPNTELYRSLKNKSGLLFYVPKDFQVISANGNRSIQAYIVNLTDTVVQIPRKDAVIKVVENYLLVNKGWKQIKTEQLAYCGNGFWTQELEPNSYLSVYIDNHDISLGTLKVRHKMRIKIGNHMLESREIDALLNSKQLEFLKQQ